MKNLYDYALKLHMHKIYKLYNPVFSQVLELLGLAIFLCTSPCATIKALSNAHPPLHAYY